MTISSTITNVGMGTPVLTKRERSLFFQDMEDDIEFTALDPDEFGESVPGMYHFVSVNKDVPLNGIFDDDYLGVDPGIPIEVESSTPMFNCQSSKLIYPKNENDTIIIRGVKYLVVSYQPDGTGMTDLILHNL